MWGSQVSIAVPVLLLEDTGSGRKAPGLLQLPYLQAASSCALAVLYGICPGYGRTLHEAWSGSSLPSACCVFCTLDWFSPSLIKADALPPVCCRADLMLRLQAQAFAELGLQPEHTAPVS